MKTFFLMQKALIVFALITPLISVAGISIDGPATIELGIATRYYAQTTGIFTGMSTQYQWINNTPSAIATFQVSGLKNSINTITVNNTDATSIEVKLNLVQYNVIIKNTTTRTLAVVRPSSLLPNIQTDYNPDVAACNQLNTYKFAINKVAQGIGYNWVLPNGWQVVSSGVDASQAFVFAKPTLINGAYPTGQVRVNVQQAAGYVAYQTYAILFPIPVSIALAPSESLCPNTSKNLVATVSGGIGALSYTWKLNGDVVDTDLSYSVSAPAIGATKIVSFTATDSRGCGKSQNVTVDNKGYGVFTFGLLSLPPGSIHQQIHAQSDLIIAMGGAPYYVGVDNKIWSYKWDGSPSVKNWINKPLNITNTATGNIIFPEGSSSLYFTSGTDNSLYKVGNVADVTPVVSSLGLNNVSKLISDYHGNVFAATQNSIYKITGSTLSSVKSGLNTIANIATANNKIFVLYTTGTIETFTLADVNTVTQITSVNPVLAGTAFKADWAGNVFFVDNQNKIEVIKNNTSTALIASADVNGIYTAAGNFVLNRSTGTVYYGSTENHIHQLYKQGGNYTWNLFSNFDGSQHAPVANTNMAIEQPNLFYVGKNQYVRFGHYSTAGCAPVAIRESEGNDGKVSINEAPVISISPNPVDAFSKLEISTNEDLSNATVTVYAFDGTLAASWLTNTNLEAGKHTIEINTSELSAGLYVVRLTSNDKTLSTVKVLVK